jgi:ribonuclease VapC
VIVVDTSALIAILLREAGAEDCRRVLESGTEILISAGTLTEALIVAGRLEIADKMLALVEELAMVVVPLAERDARIAADGYSRWGKGAHPARLNLGDCFAYGLAKARACPLLFVGDDFAKTDVTPAL